ncbi:MAG: hypothetical protein HC764_21080 [Pleurocapsa sp. CRU_1_2]|nr:hypothetical protein [Pleurocapsa sp. CRU_1_2]
MNTIDQFDKNLVQIEAKIQKTKEDTTSQEEALQEQKIKQGQLKDELAGITDPDKVLECFERCQPQLDKLEREILITELRIKVLDKTLANLQEELKNAKEDRRLFLHADYAKKIIEQVKVANNIRAEAAKELEALDELLRAAKRDVYVHDRGYEFASASNFGDANILGASSLPFIRYKIATNTVELKVAPTDPWLGSNDQPELYIF